MTSAPCLNSLPDFLSFWLFSTSDFGHQFWTRFSDLRAGSDTLSTDVMLIHLHQRQTQGWSWVTALVREVTQQALMACPVSLVVSLFSKNRGYSLWANFAQADLNIFSQNASFSFSRLFLLLVKPQAICIKHSTCMIVANKCPLFYWEHFHKLVDPRKKRFYTFIPSWNVKHCVFIPIKFSFLSQKWGTDNHDITAVQLSDGSSPIRLQNLRAQSILSFVRLLTIPLCPFER